MSCQHTSLSGCNDCMNARELAELSKQNDRYERALREILEGKRRIDIESPLGVYSSMAGRFIEIAKRALQAPSDPGGEK